MNPYLNNGLIPGLITIFQGLLCIVYTGLYAQPVLTLQDAINMGLQNNFQIRVAKNETEIADINVNPGNAGYLPSVTAHGAYGKSVVDAHVKVYTGNELKMAGAASTLSSAGVMAEWVLFEGMGRSADYGRLRELWNISSLETRITMEEVVAGIIRAYCDIIREKQLLDASRERMEVSNFRYSIAREKRDAGLASEMEWLQSQVLHHADSIALTMQEAAFRRSKITLNRFLAADTWHDFLTEDSIILVPMFHPDDLIASGLERNSSYNLAAGHLNLSRIEIKSIKADRFPRIALTGSYGYYENITEASYIRYNRNFGPQIGLIAGISLYDGSKLRRELGIARINSMNRELLVSEMEQELASLIAQIYLDYQSHLKAIFLSREGYKLARENLSIATQALQADMISTLHFREVQEEVFQAASTLINAEYQAKITETDLLRLSGLLIR
jgi:outer membrane protein